MPATSAVSRIEKVAFPFTKNGRSLSPHAPRDRRHYISYIVHACSTDAIAEGLIYKLFINGAIYNSSGRKESAVWYIQYSTWCVIQ